MNIALGPGPPSPPGASAQLLPGLALLPGHLLAAAVLQLFALVVVRRHLQQPAAVDLYHLLAQQGAGSEPDRTTLLGSDLNRPGSDPNRTAPFLQPVPLLKVQTVT